MQNITRNNKKKKFYFFFFLKIKRKINVNYNACVMIIFYFFLCLLCFETKTKGVTCDNLQAYAYGNEYDNTWQAEGPERRDFEFRMTKLLAIGEVA